MVEEERWWRCVVFYSDWWGLFSKPKLNLTLGKRGRNWKICHDVNKNDGHNLRSAEDGGFDGEFGREDFEAIGTVDKEGAMTEDGFVWEGDSPFTRGCGFGVEVSRV